MARRFPYPRSLTLGKHRQTGAPVTWSVEAQRHHAALLGTSGGGKTTLLINLIRQHIINGTGLCLFDPHGGLYKNTVEWLAFRRYDRKRTIHLIDPGEDGWRVGFNPLKAEQGDLRQISDNIEYILEAFSQAWGGEDINQMPLYQRLLAAILFAAAHKGLTLVETMKLLPVGRGDYREYAASNLPDHLQQDVWDDIQQFNNRDFQDRFGSTFNRIARFMRSYYAREMLGQKESVIDFYRCMEEGDIVLVNMASQRGLTPAAAQLLGKLFISSMFAAALGREPEVSRPFHLIIDEAEDFLSGDIPKILFQCRKFGLHLTLSVQSLGQLLHAGDRIYRGVMDGCQTKFVFGAGPTDAEELTRYVMPRGGYNLEEPIPSMIRPIPVGIEKRVVYGSTEGWAHASVETHSQSRTASLMSGTTVTLPGDVLTTMYSEEGALLGSTVTGTSVSSGDPTEATTQAITQSQSSSHAYGSVDTESGSSSWNETYVPEYRNMATQLYTIEQQRHRHAAALADQEIGHMIVKIMKDSPVPVVTQLPAPHLDKPERTRTFKDRVALASEYTAQIAQVSDEIERRQQDLERQVHAYQRPQGSNSEADWFTPSA